MGKYIVLSIVVLEVIAFLVALFLIIRTSVRRSRKAKAAHKLAIIQAAAEAAAILREEEETEAENRRLQELHEWSDGDPYEDEDGSEGYIEAVDDPLDWDDPVPDEAKLWEKESERYDS